MGQEEGEMGKEQNFAVGKRGFLEGLISSVKNVFKSERAGYLDRFGVRDKLRFEALKKRFRENYKGRVEFEDLQNEVSSMLKEGRSAEKIRKFMLKKYNNRVKESDLFDIQSLLTINKQVNSEKRWYRGIYLF